MLMQARPLRLRGGAEEGLAGGVRKMSALGLETLFPVSVPFSRWRKGYRLCGLWNLFPDSKAKMGTRSQDIPVFGKST